jgi:glycosyltransferase involved in cell wall biosynthesis
MTASLSVVMPVHNEAEHLPATVDALAEAVSRADFDAELVLVDDGSTDGSADVVRDALADRLPLRVVTQPNRGRFEARRAGLAAATGQDVLLLDGRVRIHAGALAFVRPRIEAGERVWASHVHVVDGGNPFGVFWRLLAELAWSDYFDDPRTTSFDAESFDRYPKGTTCLIAPRELLVAATEAFRSAYADPRNANDDTLLLCWIVERTRIHVSPENASSYTPRTDVSHFVRHAYHRGIVFLDGHGRPSSRFFPVVVGFYPVSAMWALAALRRKLLVPATIVGLSAAAGGFAMTRGRTREEATALALATPVYVAGHGAGMWAGLMLLARDLLRRPNGTP